MNELFPAVILMGGLATRLRPITETIPKALLTINDEPFVAHQLRLLHTKGIRKVTLCIGYLGEKIIEYVGDGSDFGVDVSYVFDGPTLLGTAGAIKNSLSILPDNFFVINGDSYLLCDYEAVQNTFVRSQKLALMTVFKNGGQWDTSNVEFCDGEIVVYDKTNRTPRMLYIDYGLEIFSKKVLDQVPYNEPYDLVPVYQALLKQKQLAAYEVTERFYENGSLAGIKDLEEYFKSTPK
jgi:MurNAc alpha-1-phosphate uridylyltransferase